MTSDVCVLPEAAGGRRGRRGRRRSGEGGGDPQVGGGVRTMVSYKISFVTMSCLNIT